MPFELLGPCWSRATVGVVAGTLVGARLLKRVPQTMFRRVVAVLLFALGIHMIAAGGRE